MSRKFQIEIPKPCHENWNKMTPVEQGRFCGSCQKAVFDFTGMSDAQLVAFFKKPSTGSVCGRFENDQLGREITLPKKRIPWFKYALQICLPVFLTTSKAISQGELKLTVKEKNGTCTKPSDRSDVILGQISPPIIKTQLIGNVINEDGEPIPFASVTIKDSKKGANCDAKGYFEIETNHTQKFITLIISSVGYEQKEKVVSNNPGSMNRIILNRESVILDEVVVNASTVTVGRLGTTGTVVISDEQQTTTGMLGGVCIRSVTKDSLLTTIKNFFIKDSLRVYPNPARSGTELKIEIRNKITGDIQVELLNLSGQLISASKINNYEKNSLLTYQLPNVLAGAYLLRLTNRVSGKTQTEKIIIQ